MDTIENIKSLNMIYFISENKPSGVSLNIQKCYLCFCQEIVLNSKAHV